VLSVLRIYLCCRGSAGCTTWYYMGHFRHTMKCRAAGRLVLCAPIHPEDSRVTKPFKLLRDHQILSVRTHVRVLGTPGTHETVRVPTTVGIWLRFTCKWHRYVPYGELNRNVRAQWCRELCAVHRRKVPWYRWGLVTWSAGMVPDNRA
jgi:hypothetical protein